MDFVIKYVKARYEIKLCLKEWAVTSCIVLHGCAYHTASFKCTSVTSYHARTMCATPLCISKCQSVCSSDYVYALYTKCTYTEPVMVCKTYIQRWEIGFGPKKTKMGWFGLPSKKNECTCITCIACTHVLLAPTNMIANWRGSILKDGVREH